MGLGFAEAAILLFKTDQEARHGRRADWDVGADRDIAMAQLPGDYFEAFLGDGVYHP